MCVVDCLVGLDEQVQGKNYLLSTGVLELGELVYEDGQNDPLGLNPLPPTVVASPIYRGPGPLPKYQAGRDPTMANLKGGS